MVACLPSNVQDTGIIWNLVCTFRIARNYLIILTTNYYDPKDAYVFPDSILDFQFNFVSKLTPVRI